MKPAAFAYHRPESPAEAVGLLAELGDEAKLLAGGQSLIPLLALRLTVVEHLIDLGRIGELSGIEQRNGMLRLGAGTTEAAVEQSAAVASAVPLLARVTPLIGHFQVRNRGTVGGSIAHADAAAEYPAVALALDASVEVLSPGGPRTIPARELFTGLWSTALADDELLVGVRFPVWTGRCGFGVAEFSRRHGDYAVAGAVVALELDGDHRIRRSGIGLIGLGLTPLRATEVERGCAGAVVTAVDAHEVGHEAVRGLTAIPSDNHGSAAYRVRIGATMVARAWTEATKEALGA